MALPFLRAARRGMASSGPTPMKDVLNAPYNGFVPPHVSPWHRYGAVAFGTLMWGWIFYRFSEDGDVLLGWRKPWDHRGHPYEPTVEEIMSDD